MFMCFLFLLQPATTYLTVIWRHSRSARHQSATVKRQRKQLWLTDSGHLKRWRQTSGYRWLLVIRLATADYVDVYVHAHVHVRIHVGSLYYSVNAILTSHDVSVDGLGWNFRHQITTCRLSVGHGRRLRSRVPRRVQPWRHHLAAPARTWTLLVCLINYQNLSNSNL